MAVTIMMPGRSIDTSVAPRHWREIDMSGRCRVSHPLLTSEAAVRDNV
jgi:hypothetical protein